MSAQPRVGETDELTVDELAAAARIPVRRIRFYAGKRLLPPPRLDGRTGLYGESHLARLRLIAELQDAGYTLSAIEEFLATVPDDADADAVALVGTLVAPNPAGPGLRMTRAQLDDALGRTVADDHLDALERANLLVVASDGCVELSRSQLEFAQRLLAVDAPLDALLEAGLVVRRHARALAEDLQDVFLRRIIAAHDEASDEDREAIRAVARALRPLTIQGIVTAYRESLDEIVREGRGAE